MSGIPEGLAERLLELAEENPLFRAQFSDLLLGSMTDLPPNAEGYECVSSIKKYIDGIGEKPAAKMSSEESERHRRMVCDVLGVPYE